MEPAQRVVESDGGRELERVEPDSSASRMPFAKVAGDLTRISAQG
jgi:hypothetical protein